MCEREDQDNRQDHPAEAAGLRSHSRLGRQLDMFHFDEWAPGMAFWHGAGMRVWNALAAYWREQNDRMGYEEVRSPLLWDAELWKRSGHWDKYRELMFHFALDEREVGLKPMNCPAHIGLYSLRARSHRELPIRLSEMGQVHRYEQSGNVNGLLRARSFVIDDAHLFCREDQVSAEVRSCLELAAHVYSLFDLEMHVELSLRPDLRIGGDALWDKAESALKEALAGAGVAYELKPGEGAFYGPKIDLHLRDSLGRMWQLGSVQLDYQLPERFDLSYVGADGRDFELVGGAKRPRRPVIIHRAMFGSFERFIAILLEHFDGRLPLWCSPRPLLVVPRGEDDLDYAYELVADLKRLVVPAAVDARNESIGKRIAEAERDRAPGVIVIGPRERQSGLLPLRRAGGAQQELPRQELLSLLAAAVKERRLSF